MVKNLNNKNRSTEIKNAETITEKKIKKKKSKLVMNTNQNNEDSTELNIKKKHKRKKSNQNEIEIGESVAKTARIDSEGDMKKQTDDNDDNDNVKKPKPLSKAQIKKAKAEQREIDKRERSKKEAIQKALQYISMWKHAKNEWKFAKIRQIWLMENLLDENSVPDSSFPTVLEYFGGCKGMARETLLKKGMEVIKKYEQKLDESEEIVETIELKRARQLLQALPTES